MSDLVVSFAIFFSFYMIFMYFIVQDVAFGYIGKEERISYWVKSCGFVSMFGLIPSFIVCDIAGNPDDVVRTTVAFLLPSLGVLMAAGIGLVIKRRMSTQDATTPTDAKS